LAPAWWLMLFKTWVVAELWRMLLFRLACRPGVLESQQVD
jgi:hypothetical protein